MELAEVHGFLDVNIRWRLTNVAAAMHAVFEVERSRSANDHEHRQVCIRVIDRAANLQEARNCASEPMLKVMVGRYYKELLVAVRIPDEPIRPRKDGFARKPIEPIKRNINPNIPASERKRHEFLSNRSFLAVQKPTQR